MLRYIKVPDEDNGGFRTDVIAKVDGDFICFVPCVEGNRDYKEYQDWIAKGNSPEE